MSIIDKSSNAPVVFCDFDIHLNTNTPLKEKRKQINRHGHTGMVYRLTLPEGFCLHYYNLLSTSPGNIIINNKNPFLLLSYTLNGSRSFTLNGRHPFASFQSKEFNYLYFPNKQINLSWKAEERIEAFEISISPETILRYIPPQHPFYSMLNTGIDNNMPVLMSKQNLTLQSKSSSILYNMLHCPLEGRYKELYIRSKLGELLAIELGSYEQALLIKRGTVERPHKLRQQEIERMHHARDIIIANMNSPCSLIDLAHQVGTNEAYLKRHFKEVFGTTVFGYLHVMKMSEARKLLAEGMNVSEVSFLSGYKHTGHFTRAFKKYFGINPNQVRR